MSASNGKRVLGKDDLLAIRTPAPVPVRLEGEGTVYVRAISAAERDRYESGNFRYEGGRSVPVFDNLRGRLVALCACDEKGERLFEDADAGAVGCLPAPVVDALFEAAQRLNALGGRALEEAEKNSERTDSSASSSSSPAT